MGPTYMLYFCMDPLGESEFGLWPAGKVVHIQECASSDKHEDLPYQFDLGLCGFGVCEIFQG